MVGAGPGGLATVVLEAEAPGGQAGTSSRIGPGLLATSLPGVFAVGDVRADSIKRVASAVGEGSIVISSVHEALHDGRARPQARRARPCSANASRSVASATGPTPCMAASSCSGTAATASSVVRPAAVSARVAGAPIVGSRVPVGGAGRSRGGPPSSTTASPRGESR